MDLLLLSGPLFALSAVWVALFDIHLPSDNLPLFDYLVQLHVRRDPLAPGGLLVMGMVATVYFFISHLLFGRTAGMKLLGLQVVGEDEGPLGPGAAALRVLGAVLGGAYFGLGFLWIVFDPRHQGLHDRIAGTLVIRSLDGLRRGERPAVGAGRSGTPVAGSVRARGENTADNESMVIV